MDPLEIVKPDRRAWFKKAGLFGLGAAALLNQPARAAAPAAPAAAPGRVRTPAEFRALMRKGRLTLPLTPSSALGPYYLANAPYRSDITDGQTGLPLKLFYRVVNANTEIPYNGAVVDLWHANACGVYSGFANQGTLGQMFLRGKQNTDANGWCVFDTIFPGWYQGRTAHLHARVRSSPTAVQVLTTQFYFGDLYGYPGIGVNANVYQYISPYASCGAPQTTNATDGLFNPNLLQTTILAGDGTFGLWAGIVIAI